MKDAILFSIIFGQWEDDNERLCATEPHLGLKRFPHPILFYLFHSTVFLRLKQSQNLDLSYQTDLDCWDCLGRVKLIAKFSY